MTKTALHIEIVRSTQPWLSSLSAASSRAIAAVLNKHYGSVRVTVINSFSDLTALVGRQPDLVFLGMKFLPGHPELGKYDPDKIWIAGYLAEQGIAFTGSNHRAHELELDKALAKQRVQAAGLNTSPFYVIKKGQSLSAHLIPLTFPVFIKPTDRGGGQGIDNASIAYNFTELQAKVQSIASDLQADSLIESYLPGREFSVAILKDAASAAFSVMPLELIAPLDARGARLLTAAVKKADTERFIAVTDEAIKTKITQLALDVFNTLGARDYGRIDIRLDAIGTPQFLEANLLPSLIKGYGNFPKACLLNAGLDYEPMILSLVRLAAARISNPETEPFLEPILQYA